MTNPLYNKHVISISDLTRSDMELVVATAQRLKAEPDTRLFVIGLRGMRVHITPQATQEAVSPFDAGIGPFQRLVGR